MPDFTMIMEWKFESWVPFVSALLPNDRLVLRKRGGSFRMDSTLLSFEGLKWKRGSISIMLPGPDAPRGAGEITFLDHDHRVMGTLKKDLLHPKSERSVRRLCGT